MPIILGKRHLVAHISARFFNTGLFFPVMNCFIYLSWLKDGKYWHTPLTRRRKGSPIDSSVEGYFVLFKEQNESQDRGVLIGMLQEDLLSNNPNPYEVIEAAARDSKYWNRIHGPPSPLKNPAQALVVGKGMYSVEHINRKATLYADEKSDDDFLKQVATKSKSLVGITINDVLRL